jgi:hypothetical protein
MVIPVLIEYVIFPDQQVVRKLIHIKSNVAGPHQTA